MQQILGLVSALLLLPSFVFAQASGTGTESFDFGGGRRMELSADAFNLFNNDASFGFLSADERASNFAVKTNFVQPRVGQVGVRVVF